jgi:hypothetical protein
LALPHDLHPVPLNLQPIALAMLVVPVNAVTYLAITSWWDIPEAAVLTGRLRRTWQRVRRAT